MHTIVRNDRDPSIKAVAIYSYLKYNYACNNSAIYVPVLLTKIPLFQENNIKEITATFNSFYFYRTAKQYLAAINTDHEAISSGPSAYHVADSTTSARESPSREA